MRGVIQSDVADAGENVAADIAGEVERAGKGDDAAVNFAQQVGFLAPDNHVRSDARTGFKTEKFDPGIDAVS